MKKTTVFCEKCGVEIDWFQFLDYGECIDCNPFACDDGYRLAREARAFAIAVEKAERFEASKLATPVPFEELCADFGLRFS